MTRDDVLHVRSLARSLADDESVPRLVSELNAIPAMEVLKRSTRLAVSGGRCGRCGILRVDAGRVPACAPARGIRAGDARRVLHRAPVGDP